MMMSSDEAPPPHPPPPPPRPFVEVGGGEGEPGLAYDADEEVSDEEPAGEEPESLQQRALSTQHLMCHKPFNARCKVCVAVRSRKRRHMRRLRAVGQDLEAFGEAVTCDHIIAETQARESIEGHMYAVVIYDLYTRFVGAYPSLTKTSMETLQHLQKWRGKDEIKFMYSDGSKEIANACRLEQVPHTACEPGDKQANGIAERQVQEIKLTTASNLAQAGLPHPYWVYAMNHAMMALNVTRRASGEATPWEARFGEAFPGRMIPFGAAVAFHPNRENRGRTELPFADKAVEGIFLGYHRTIGEQWKGDYEVAFFSDFAKIPLVHGYKPSRVEVLPIRTPRVFVPDGPWTFPLRERYVRENGTLGGAAVAEEAS